MQRISQTDTLPWYRQFWPWFIFGLPAVVVVASLVTAYIAINNQDPVIDGNYYKHGLTINERLEDKQAPPATDSHGSDTPAP